MILLIDIGNTDTVVGLCQRERIFHVIRFPTYTVRSAGALPRAIFKSLSGFKKALPRIEGCVLCSVVPSLDPFYLSFFRQFKIRTICVNHRIRLNIKITYDPPAAVGADRIANAVAARTLTLHPAIVVDLGTATTFDVIDRQGRYLGGLITPGMKIAMEELARRTAKLFEIKLSRPKKFVGTHTAGSLMAGLYYGTIGEIEFIVKRIKALMGEKTIVFGTGGLINLIRPDCPVIERVLPELTLLGLLKIYQFNQKKN